MTLLDIISYDEHGNPLPRRRRFREIVDTVRQNIKVNDVTDSVSSADSTAVADTVAANSSASDALTNNLGVVTDSSSALPWTIVAVLAALCLCFYMVHLYRARLTRSER